MKAQSLSVVVPNPGCINNCRFCVSRMHANAYRNQMDDNLPFFDLYLKDYLKRLEFAQRNGCNTVMLTGSTEPQQNRKFLTYFGLFMQMIRDPFDWVEMQTTGILLDRNYLRFLRNHVGVNLISVSLSAFSPELNMDITGMPKNKAVYPQELCRDIKEYDFSLRISLNLNKAFDGFAGHPERLLGQCRKLGADQVTLRVLYETKEDVPQARWVRENRIDPKVVEQLACYIRENGTVLGVLPYGAVKYSVDGMSVVLDDDCMSKGVSNLDDHKLPEQDTYKYLILQPNCKLYSRWDDPASLIF